MVNIRIGNGFDVHELVKNRKLILGGVQIDHFYGLKGHSDADVLVHAMIDSLLGAVSMGDIGILFPDNDERYKDISSIILLKEVFNKISEKCITIINIDSTIICEKPKISPYIIKMKSKLSLAMGNLPIDRIGIKATTSEKLGFTGREEGIAVFSTALVEIS